MRLAFVISLLAACTSSDGTAEPGLTRANGGGYCCPIDPETCNCFRNGGWIARADDMCPRICDLAPVNTSIEPDAHGCDVLSGPVSCLAPPDAATNVDETEPSPKDRARVGAGPVQSSARREAPAHRVQSEVDTVPSAVPPR